MNATLYSEVARIEIGDFLRFHCEPLSHHQRDVQRYFFGVYYPRWHSFYLEEVRSIIGNLGYAELKHFPAFPLDVYVNEHGETFRTEDFQVDNVIVLGHPQDQRDDDIKRFKIVMVDDKVLRTRTTKLPPISNSSLAHPQTMMMTSSAKRVSAAVDDDVVEILRQLRDAYVYHWGGGIPENGVKAMGRHFRKVDDDGRRWMTREGIMALVRDSRMFGANSCSLADTQKSQTLISSVADIIFDAFPHGEESGAVDYDSFMDVIRGHMNETRKKAVWETFCKLDFDGDGQLSILDIQARFNAHEHPVVVRDGFFSAAALLKGFLNVWDENNREYGMVPYAEFLDYYNGLSAAIEKDEVFVAILKTTWKMPQFAEHSYTRLTS